MDNEIPHPKLPLLTESLLDTITFAMEDQGETYYLDLESGTVVSHQERQMIAWQGEEPPSKERYIDIPSWLPSDGFLVMEKFVHQVRNPIYHDKLLGALQSGKGVFRKFKDIIGEQSSLERQWFAFKDEQLKQRVYAWYREHNGSLQLLSLNLEPEELTDDILQEDFLISEVDEIPPMKEILALQEQLLKEMESGDEKEQKSLLLLKRSLVEESSNTSFYIFARTGEGELAGFIQAVVMEKHTLEVRFFGTKQEFRGMGLFRFLFDHLCRRSARAGFTSIVANLSGKALALEKLFSTLGSATVSKHVLLSTNAWNENTPSSEGAYL